MKHGGGIFEISPSAKNLENTPSKFWEIFLNQEKPRKLAKFN